MAFASDSAIGYGPSLSIKTFEGASGNFEQFQWQLQQACPFSYVSLLSPDAQEKLDNLLRERDDLLVKAQAKDGETMKDTTAINYRETKIKDMIKEDSILHGLLVKSVKGRARDTAFQQQAFVLNDKPTLQGAQAYQRLVKEYGKKKACIADKYTEKQEILSHFIAPNFSSPQIDIHLMTIAKEHILKFKYPAPQMIFTWKLLSPS